MKNFIAFLIGVFISLALFWVGGFDFDKRGAEAFLCAFTSLSCGALAYIAYQLLKLEGVFK
jgi:hypothetical protein